MKKIVLLIILVTQIGYVNSSSAFFDQGYMSAQDMISALYLKFGKVILQNDYSCQTLSDSHRKSLGDSNPMTGEVPISLPDSSFLTWIQDCINTYHSTTHTIYAYSTLPETQKIRADEFLNLIYAPLMPKFLEYKKTIPMVISVLRFQPGR